MIAIDSCTSKFNTISFLAKQLDDISLLQQKLHVTKAPGPSAHLSTFMGGIMQLKQSFQKKNAVIKGLRMHSNHELIEIQAHNESKVFFKALIRVRS